MADNNFIVNYLHNNIRPPIELHTDVKGTSSKLMFPEHMQFIPYSQINVCNFACFMLYL